MSKAQKINEEFKSAEAIGQIKTMPEVELDIEPAKREPGAVLTNPEDFRMAIGHAQMEGEEFVEVDEKLFKYLTKNSKTRYITYGDPGVKVFLAGTREEIEKEDMMPAEKHHDHMARKKQTEVR